MPHSFTAHRAVPRAYRPPACMGRAEALTWCRQHLEQTSAWERDFLAGITRNPALTPAAFGTLLRIAGELPRERRQ